MAVEAKLVPQNWSYKVIRRTTHNDSTQKEEDFLNGQGSDGWMLCEVKPQRITGALWYYFMKPG